MRVLVELEGLKVASALAEFIEQRALPGTGIEPDRFWAGTAKIFATFAPENRALGIFQLRTVLQAWKHLRW